MEVAELHWVLTLSQISAGGARPWRAGTDVTKRPISSKATKDAKRLDRGELLGAGESMEGRVVGLRMEKMGENHLMQKFPLNKRKGVPLSLDQFHFCKIITVRYLVWSL